jgi:hypothetical protein
VKILTNHPGRVASPSWRNVTTYYKAAPGFLPAVRVALTLYWQQRHHDCVVLGGGTSDLLFALLQSVLPIWRKPTMMVDCLWYAHPNAFMRRLKGLLMRFADRSVDRYCVWATREVEAYSTAFGLPRRKFVFVPYHTTLDGHPLATTDGGYLFSGGNWARDYPTLIEAVTDLPVTLHIACTRPELFNGLPIPANVVIQGYSHAEYLRMMAGCTINIVALAPDLLHSGGQQTFLNSMWLGKATIVTDPEGACDYIEDGVDGVLVAAGKVAPLRDAIASLLANPERTSEMGQKAEVKVRSGYSTDDHFRKIIALASELSAATVFSATPHKLPEPTDRERRQEG